MQNINAILCLFLMLSACSRVVSLVPMPDLAPARDRVVQHVLITTSRVPAEGGPFVFSDARSPQLNFADIDVSIPENREAGTLPLPRRRVDASRDFTATSIEPLDTGQDFIDRVNERIAADPEAQGRILIFIHGYNISFPRAVYRTAQLRHDFDFEAIAVGYSWPSAGRTLQYVYDRDSASFGRSGLVETLDLLAQSNAREIRLVAHSMGSQVAFDALLELAARRRKDVLEMFEAVVFASPDIDVDVFMQDIQILEPLRFPMVVLTNPQDRALNLSRALRGGHARVGQVESVDALLEKGIIVFEVAGRRRGIDPFGHLGFATSPALIELISNTSTDDLLALSQQGKKTELRSNVKNAQGQTDLVLYLPRAEDVPDRPPISPFFQELSDGD